MVGEGGRGWPRDEHRYVSIRGETRGAKGEREGERERECKKRIEELLGGEQRVGGRGLAVVRPGGEQ